MQILQSLIGYGRIFLPLRFLNQTKVGCCKIPSGLKLLKLLSRDPTQWQSHNPTPLSSGPMSENNHNTNRNWKGSLPALRMGKKYGREDAQIISSDLQKALDNVGFVQIPQSLFWVNFEIFEWERFSLSTSNPFLMFVSTLFSQTSREASSACVPPAVRAASQQDRLAVCCDLSATLKMTQAVAWRLALKETAMINRSKTLCYLKLSSAVLHISKWLFSMKINNLLFLFTALCSQKNPCRHLARGLL